MRKLLVGVVLLSGIALGFFLIQGKLPFNLSWPWGKKEAAEPQQKKPAIVYQWQDEFGRTQMSNEPPPEGIEYTVSEVKGNLTSMGPMPVVRPVDSSLAKNKAMNSLSGFVQDASKAAEAADASQEQTQRTIDQNK